MQQLGSEGSVGCSMQHEIRHVVVAVTSQQGAAKVVVKGLCALVFWLGCCTKNIHTATFRPSA